MTKTTNAWLISNERLIETIKTQCVEYDMKGSYGGNIQLNLIVRIFDGATIEIARLQEKYDLLERENKVLKDNVKNLQEKIS